MSAVLLCPISMGRCNALASLFLGLAASGAAYSKIDHEDLGRPDASFGMNPNTIPNYKARSKQSCVSIVLNYYVYGWVSYTSSNVVQETSDGLVPTKYGTIPNAGSKVKEIILTGVCHSEMGNNTLIKQTLRDILNGTIKLNDNNSKSVFWIQPRP